MKHIYHKLKNIISRNLKKDTWMKRCLSQKEYRKWTEEQFFSKKISTLYPTKKTSGKGMPTVIYISDNKWVSGGLCDKLRGMISLYVLCKELKLTFKIYCHYPFDLKDYLKPNLYDWELNHEIKRDCNCTAVCRMSYYHYLDSNEKKEQKHDLIKKIKKNKNYNEIHIYTNAHFGNPLFHESFKELFKPSTHIQDLINQFKINEPYISMSFRFRQLLGDFTDNSGGEILPIEEQNNYISDSLNLIKTYYQKNIDKNEKILVTSDSCTFISLVQELSYVIIIPGIIKHSDRPAENFDKEFLDFFMISKAEKVYLCKKEKMWYSGFPYYASLVGNKPFEVISY